MRFTCFANVAIVGTLIGCIANPNMQRGDAAAARGAWRNAEIAYRTAVQERPNDVELAKKYANAKTHAVDEAMLVFAACQAANDDACVERELDYVLLIDATNLAAARARTTAKQGRATKLLIEARRFLDNSQPIETWKLIAEVRALGVPEDAVLILQKLEGDSVVIAQDMTSKLLLAATNAESLQALNLLDQAVMLANGIAERSADKNLQIQVATKRQSVVVVEVGRLKSEEVNALAASDYDKAAVIASQIARLTPNKETVSRATWCGRVAEARKALERRDFPAAVQFAKEAQNTGVDTGIAQLIIDQAETRVYTVRLGAVVISPTNPQTGKPWVGKPWWSGTASDLIGATEAMIPLFNFSGVGGIAAKLATQAAKRAVETPVANMPWLYVEIALPDKRRFASAQPQKGLNVSFGSSFSILTNKLDRRNVIFTIRQKKDGGDQLVAELAVPLGALVADPTKISIKPTAEMAALLGMEIQIDTASMDDDGAVEKLRSIDIVENQASKRSMPSRGATRMRLERVTAVLPNEEGDMGGTPPDPFLRLTQNGALVVQTPTHGNNRNSQWTFASADLFVSDSDQFVLTLLDDNDISNTTLFSCAITGRSIRQGEQLACMKPNGTQVTLVISDWISLPE